MKPLLIVAAVGILLAVGWLLIRRPKYEPTIESTYQGEPMEYQGEKTLIVAVYAPWAGVWNVTEAELAKLDKTRYDLALISADNEKERVRSLQVEIVPTVLVIRDGKILKRLPNLMSLDQIDVSE